MRGGVDIYWSECCGGVLGRVGLCRVRDRNRKSGSVDLVTEARTAGLYGLARLCLASNGTAGTTLRIRARVVAVGVDVGNTQKREMKKMKFSFFSQRHALSTSFDIF